jgi:hypothetical protein
MARKVREHLGGGKLSKRFKRLFGLFNRLNFSSIILLAMRMLTHDYALLIVFGDEINVPLRPPHLEG